MDFLSNTLLLRKFKQGRRFALRDPRARLRKKIWDSVLSYINFKFIETWLQVKAA